MSYQRYVLGFAFFEDKVVLIRKERPAWQAGFLNGVGGHIEDSDKTPADAMAREFSEETSVMTSVGRWMSFAIMRGKDWDCHCFVIVCNRHLYLGTIWKRPLRYCCDCSTGARCLYNTWGGYRLHLYRYDLNRRKTADWRF